ncbi:BTB domain-containing protein [Mycena chlorophos]|uniref:BTB domain-containing protein n=1 Tax=Mycena chlorophos TaxID=658473 RepID=A0A8H6S1Z5_MYCCL|nr:BTB domain-containing protein [Mycena chlorophos]
MADEEPITRDGKPVLKLEESHSVIHKLLCHAYPPRFPRQSKLDADDIDPDFVGIYRAAHKYQFLVVVETLKTAMNEFSALRAFPDPYRVFAIGKLLGHTKLAKAAIFASAGCDIKPEALDFPELRLLAWADGQHMLRLNVRYKEGVRAALEPAQTPHSYVVHSPHSYYHSANVTFAWFQQQQQHSGSCRLSDSPDGACAQWFTSHIANVRDGGLKLPHLSDGHRGPP